VKYAFYMGCAAPVRGRHYEMATRIVCEGLGIELVDIPEFSCCGFPIKKVAHDTFFLLSARNLALAEQKGLDIMTICNSCTGVMTEVNHLLRENQEVREKTNTQLAGLGLEYKGNVQVNHLIRVLYEDVGVEKLKEKVKRDVSAWKLAPHYGCHFAKPSAAYGKFDDPEYPHILKELMAAIGLGIVEHDKDKACCGGAILAVSEDIALKMAGSKLASVRGADGDGICLHCTFCSVMYDDNQGKINQAMGTEYALPIIYYPQVLGLAMGYDPKDLGLRMNRVKTKDLLEKIAI
jgi:heterodisulfide reductase subunit B